MKKLAEWAKEQGNGSMLTPEDIGLCAVNAALFASAFIDFEGVTDFEVEPELGDEPIVLDMELSRYHWTLISPLFSLYCQRKEAILLEASRPLMVEVFGRTVSEIDSEIRQLEDDFSRRTFMRTCFSI